MKTLTEELPILFNDQMICAILEGRKSQTRRISGLEVLNKNPNEWEFVEPSFSHTHNGVRTSVLLINKKTEESVFVDCPYGTKRSLLWVRESWRIGAWNVSKKSLAFDYRANDFARKEWIEISDKTMFERLIQQSQNDAFKAGLSGDQYQWEPGESPCRWRPSIHMPRVASRLILEIKNIRVERLVTLSEEDALAEGVEIDSEECDHVRYSCSDIGCLGQTYKSGFAKLWIELHGQSAWSINPWVWVIEFEIWEDELPY
ncbi:hypothetical protein JWG45_03765 [Leptospira sp. 201903070]|uniref:Phage tail protein n=1 Tax=Leptospira ainlahdjerensis TaxID=2810033 RepID=A0ABS2U812_9LEPT|nr:hypothetical protein [Leptospira ainlahdjerensis]MBM9576264.1 hypothetical protein [Leptospira ainlahdjerensis]